MKITIEANSFTELFTELSNMNRPSTPPAPLSANENTTEEKAEKKTRKAKETTTETSSAKTPLEQSNEEHAKETSTAAPVFADMSKAIMEVVKAHDKPTALAILRTFKHKDSKEGEDLIVNGPPDIADKDFAAVIEKMTAKAKEQKAA